ncbi:hypothetical protein A3742_26720 [Oleiphilus sp. HI0071]|uniref:urease accessory protein UreE n=1 Tax=unclassified Oleiphilus TaxID=2631174 RepID=UPI0007C40C62|nr:MULTISPECIES: urease accessory protein UreE [unclassified Oleiphilus]KZY61235.1 hypothetical protein A3737_22255 [Oleiphilus sp. HI0065]KZY83580.1 hypothetical protein A3742_06965 [Oleiphilus sp. HI0071]KZY97791.1 hypothetical protein A3744_00985 [Oleiphilus sp. HI0073]KZZ52175.1 hypothetical protein A3760_18270 [Oleiphilus sp. HI0122]KZY73041.1 hypothetical protein A3737_09795 [Oleiphilus sp. HI0065]
MIEVVKKLHLHGAPPREPELTVVLDYDQRTKGRLKATAVSGEPLGLFLERGKVLRDGDVLECSSGELVLVKSANETLVEATCDDWLTFSKCCYHLGNRHVPIQVEALRLRMRPDYILEDMLKQLGMRTTTVSAGFDPEQGAYAGGHHHH